MTTREGVGPIASQRVRALGEALCDRRLSAEGRGVVAFHVVAPAPPPLLVSQILHGTPNAELRSGRRVRARFLRLREGWIAVIPDDLMLGPFGGLRPAAVATLAHLDRTEGMGTRVGAVLACRPGDLVFEPCDSVSGRRR